MTRADGLAGPELDFSTPSALADDAVTALQASTQSPGLRPAAADAGAAAVLVHRTDRLSTKPPEGAGRAPRHRRGREPVRGRGRAVRRRRDAGRPGLARPSASRSRADETLWVDERRHTAGDQLRVADPARGIPDRAARGWPAPSRCAAGRPPSPAACTPAPPSPYRPRARSRWAAPRRPTSPSTRPSASWSHVTVEREEDGVRVRDAGSTNGTLVDGVEVGEEGVLVEDEAVVVAGGTAITLRRDARRDPGPGPGLAAQPDHRRHRAVQPAAAARARPRRRSPCSRRCARTRRRRPASASPPSSAR